MFINLLKTIEVQIDLKRNLTISLLKMSEDFKDFFSNSILKFESMLKSNKFLFFDVDEFESIIIYYLESGNTSLANKAIKMASKQYPENSAISLLKIESLIVQNKIDEAEKLVNKLFLLESNNSEIILQKSRIFSKRKTIQNQ